MTTRGFDGEVCIGVPPTAVVSATSLEPPHFSLGSDDSSPERSNRRRFLCNFLLYFSVQILIVLFLLAMFGLIFAVSNTSFKLESMSVASDKSDLSYNQSQAIRAAWDVGFSIKYSGSVSSVSVRCLSSDWSASPVQDTRNTASSIHAVVITSLPREFVLSDHDDQLKMGGLTLQFDVLFETAFPRITETGECKNMSIVIPPNQTQGLMVGGPRKCH